MKSNIELALMFEEEHLLFDLIMEGVDAWEIREYIQAALIAIRGPL